jgi:GrpB-like predicted nucleotidyltransferase (UPF0157 family)
MDLIIPYQFSWKQDFDNIRSVLMSVLEPFNLNIEHVGSTAIENLAAKPIIDIDIVFHEGVTFGELKGQLEELGYHHVGDQGIKEREVFKRKSQDHLILDTIPHHLYVCPWYSEEFQRHIRFRDHLRNNVSARQKYERLKLSIAQEANQDRKLYAQLKETRARKFIESIVEK